MRIAVVIILTFIKFYLIGQQLSYNGFPVDSIKVSTDFRCLDWNKNIEVYMRYDLCLIVFDKIKMQYVIKKCESSSINYIDEYSNNEKKIKSFDNAINKKVPWENIDSLLFALQTKYKKPDMKNIGFDSISLTKRIKENNLKNIHEKDLKYLDLYGYFNYEIYDNEWGENCLQLNNFKKFLKIAFDTTGYAVEPSERNVMILNIYTSGNVYSYEGKFPNIFKQPWYDYSKLTNGIPKSILNFDINLYLDKILPDEYPSKKELGISSLVDEYLLWYFICSPVDFETQDK